MQRRSFLKRASAASLVASFARSSLAHAFSDGKQPRVAYGGIGIECSTYGRIRARMEDFTILRGKELTDSKRFAFLKTLSGAVHADRGSRKLYPGVQSKRLPTTQSRQTF
jgi:hypothetical protein